METCTHAALKRRRNGAAGQSPAAPGRAGSAPPPAAAAPGLPARPHPAATAALESGLPRWLPAVPAARSASSCPAPALSAMLRLRVRGGVRKPPLQHSTSAAASPALPPQRRLSGLGDHPLAPEALPHAAGALGCAALKGLTATPLWASPGADCELHAAASPSWGALLAGPAGALLSGVPLCGRSARAGLARVGDRPGVKSAARDLCGGVGGTLCSPTSSAAQAGCSAVSAAAMLPACANIAHTV